MTTMDVAPPAVLRLFSRLDFGTAPEPQALAGLLEQWNAARGGRPLPQVGAVTARPDFFPAGFVASKASAITCSSWACRRRKPCSAGLAPTGD